MHHNDLYDSVETACLGKYGSQIKCKNVLGQSDGRIFEIWYLKNYWMYKLDFLHTGAYQLKLQIDD